MGIVCLTLGLLLLLPAFYAKGQGVRLWFLAWALLNIWTSASMFRNDAGTDLSPAGHFAPSYRSR